MNPERRDVLLFMLQHQQNQLIQAQHILSERRRRRRGRRRVVRSIWVRDWIARRPHLGLYDRPMVELRSEDPRAAITLRHIASGFKYRDMEYGWRVPHNSISLVVLEVCEAIVHEYAQEMLSPRHTEAQWRQLADDWYHKWNFPHVIGAIDGKHVACKAPANTGSDYYN